MFLSLAYSSINEWHTFLFIKYYTYFYINFLSYWIEKTNVCSYDDQIQIPDALTAVEGMFIFIKIYYSIIKVVEALHIFKPISRRLVYTPFYPDPILNIYI